MFENFCRKSYVKKMQNVGLKIPFWGNIKLGIVLSPSFIHLRQSVQFTMWWKATVNPPTCTKRQRPAKIVTVFANCCFWWFIQASTLPFEKLTTDWQTKTVTMTNTQKFLYCSWTKKQTKMSKGWNVLAGKNDYTVSEKKVIP